MRVSRPDPIEYMLRVARTPAAVAYKAHVLAELDLSPGHIVVDVGCGPGTDLLSMQERVAPDGCIVGLDVDLEMLRAASGRVAYTCSVAAGDAHRLPLASASVDRLRTDRSLQHMHRPDLVLAEFDRVLRPGGIAVVAEPDWGTMAIDTARADVSERFVAYTCREVVRNATIGRQLARFGVQAGLAPVNVVAFPTVLREFAAADKIFGLTRNALAAVAAGYLDHVEAASWLAELASQPMLAAVTLFVSTLVKTADASRAGNQSREP